jgi:bacterioferritin-associated ferredoxin
LAPRPLPARTVAMVAMARADPGLIRDGLRYRAVLARARVPVIYSSAVSRVEGDAGVRTAVVSSVTGSLQGDQRHFDVDAVCLGLGFVPSTDMARSLGCRHRYDAMLGQLVTEVDARGATSVERIWVVGDGAGIRGARHAQAQGALAAVDVARKLGRAIPDEVARLEAAADRSALRHRRFQHALAGVFRAPLLSDELSEPSTYVCRCEGVSRQAVEAALADGANHIGSIKRQTRAGMGPCQGRYCAPILTAMLARRTGEQPDELSGFAPAPPTKPVAIGDLLALRD